MIDIFEALGWLNALGNHTHLNNEARRLSKAVRRFSLRDASVKRLLGTLRHAGQPSTDPLEKAEILLHCAAIEYWRGWLPQAACDANEALIQYANDAHRRAVVLWMLGKIQWDMLQNHAAHKSWDESRKTFCNQQVFLRHHSDAHAWYQNAIWQIDVELAARPEEISTWLNHFEDSSLKLPTRHIVKRVKKRICQQSYQNAYALMQDLQEATKLSQEVYERAEIYLEFGMAVYHLGSKHFATELLRKSVRSFFPGIGSYHKQAVARCLLGAIEWMNPPPHHQAAADWMQSIKEFKKLQWWAERDNMPEKKEWYARRAVLLQAALSDQSPQAPSPDTGPTVPTDVPPPSEPKPPDRFDELVGLVHGDIEQANRLVEFECGQFPQESRAKLIERAIERLLDDRR